MPIADLLARPLRLFQILEGDRPDPDAEEERIRRQVRAIEIRARRLLRDQLAGEFRSAFRGRGLEFAEIRQYLPGDEVRQIDWKVTARLAQPYVRQYVEEREQSVMLLLDVSASTDFGTVGRSVRSLATELAGVLGFAAAFANDLVGVVAFSDRVEYTLPPRKGANHVLRMLRDLLRLEPYGRETTLAAALDYAGRLTRRRSVIFVISDFLTVPRDDPWESALRRLSLRHDVVAIALRDPHEAALPGGGIVSVADSETGVRQLVGRPEAERAATLVREQRARLERRLRATGADALTLTTDDDYFPRLVGLFRARRRRQ